MSMVSEPPFCPATLHRSRLTALLASIGTDIEAELLLTPPSETRGKQRPTPDLPYYFRHVGSSDSQTTAPSPHSRPLRPVPWTLVLGTEYCNLRTL